MAKKKKPLSRRDKIKYKNLNPSYNLRSRSELLDYDYLDKLNDKEKAFLDKFSKEFIGASFEKEDKKKKGKRRKLKNLHQSEAHIKSCYDANNARNRDVLTRAKAQGKADYIEDIVSNEYELNDLLRETLHDGKDNTNGGDNE
jgi:hypothetical protein